MTDDHGRPCENFLYVFKAALRAAPWPLRRLAAWSPSARPRGGGPHPEGQHAASGGDLRFQDGRRNPITDDPGRADTEPALPVKVVRLVRRSTLTGRAEPVSTGCGSTATGWQNGAVSTRVPGSYPDNVTESDWQDLAGSSLPEWIGFAHEHEIPISKMLAIREKILDQQKPSDAAIVERAIRLANNSVGAVVLQVRRIQSVLPSDPTDDDSSDRIFQVFNADIPFMILALTWVRRAALLAGEVDSCRSHIRTAIASFDGELPALLKMRNVREHIDDYALDAPERGPRRRTQRRADGSLVGRRLLEVGSFGDYGFRWLVRQPKIAIID